VADSFPVLLQVREGLYSPYAQRNIIPAQYMRDEARIEQYLHTNKFLRDINNERPGDDHVGPIPEDQRPTLAAADDEPEPRNATYKQNFLGLSKLVLLRFTRDTTVVSPQTAHFTLPSPNATNCPPLSEPGCYLDPVEWDDLPLYKEDYIGLKELNERW
jgi:palmitoyl-protein thioesterase